MKTAANIFYFLFFTCSLFTITTMESGCAQIGAPTGGPRDSIAPVLVKASPALNSINVTDNKITLTFDEYIDVKDALSNVLVSPYPQRNPTVDYKLKTVTIKLKDTLLANTTYSIDFGNAIRDNNEGNLFNNFTYVFSTGNTIDSLQLRGKVLLAETGKTDSTLIAMLYRSTEDSAVQKRKPDYIARLNGQGEFVFKNLAAGTYRLYALNDGDGGKTYNSPIEQFAFLNESVKVTGSDSAHVLYAFAAEKDKKNITAVTSSAPADKKFRYTTSLIGNLQDILTDLSISFSRPVKSLDSNKITLSDTNYKPIAHSMLLDSTQKILSIKSKWIPDANYVLIISKDALKDSLNNTLAKSDTVKFRSKSENDYGSLALRFTNLVLTNHPVLQFVQGDMIIRSFKVTTPQWSDKLFPPGEYELRVLYDTNDDGQWTPGSFTQKRQPERVITLDKKLSIKSNWDNEREIQL